VIATLSGNNEMNLDDIHSIIGSESYNRLVETFKNTAKHQRFRFWQEKLFARLAEETGETVSFEMYLKLFGRARHRKEPVAREAFLQAPVAAWQDQTIEIDPTWMGAVWDTSEEFRNLLLDECLCSIALTDTLKELSRDPSYLTDHLSNEAANEIYEHVARWACMPESDWRSAFVQMFGPNYEFPQESGLTAAAMAESLRDELVAPLRTTANISDWIISPRIVTAGTRECWLLLKTPTNCGLVYSPYGSLEPSHKWGVVDSVDQSTAEDQIWAASLEDAFHDFVQIQESTG